MNAAILSLWDYNNQSIESQESFSGSFNWQPAFLRKRNSNLKVESKGLPAPEPTQGIGNAFDVSMRGVIASDGFQGGS